MANKIYRCTLTFTKTVEASSEEEARELAAEKFSQSMLMEIYPEDIDEAKEEK